MLVSSTGLTLGIACVYTHKCTYTHTGKSDSKSEIIIYYFEKGSAMYKMFRVTNKCWYLSEANGRGFS